MAGNQYQPDPRQSDFLQRYLNPESPTFSNAKQSAIGAGYSEEYADNIMALYPDWLSEALGQNELLSIAESNIRELLLQGEDIKVKADITKFVASRAGKHKWSERKELTGKDGDPIKYEKIEKLSDEELEDLIKKYES